VWTGIEYQVAAHLIYQGLLEEGLAIVRAVSERYDGVRRNPWNQIEWGNHYTRAMASYSVLLALSGFRYSAVEKAVTFQPRINPENFKCFFAAGSAWGLYSQQRQAKSLAAKLECQHGEFTLRHLILGNESKLGMADAATLTGPDGRTVPCTVKQTPDGLFIEFSTEITIPEGKSIAVIIGPAPNTKKA
jgi:hypothetical protein